MKKILLTLRNDGEKQSWRRVLCAVVFKKSSFYTRQAELERIRKKRETKNQHKPPKKKIKQEIKSTFLPGQVIDLT